MQLEQKVKRDNVVIVAKQEQKGGMEQMVRRVKREIQDFKEWLGRKVNQE